MRMFSLVLWTMYLLWFDFMIGVAVGAFAFVFVGEYFFDDVRTVSSLNL